MKNLLIRNVPAEDIDWVSKTKPFGLSQNDYLKSILAKARTDLRHDDLFAAPVEPPPIYSSAPFKFVDVFAGIGGFRIGMTAIGGKCVYANEWDKHACKTYRYWYGDSGIDTRDITEVDIRNDIPEHDILCAGFPRQSFSTGGVQREDSSSFSDRIVGEKVGKLFLRVMDIVDCKRPPVLFLEDVKNLTTHNKGNTFKAVERSIRERGYTLSAKVFDACNWVPQHRERTFLVCFDTDVFAHDLNFNFEFPDPPANKRPTLKSILLSKGLSRRYMLSDRLWSYLQEYAKKHRAKGNGFGYGLFAEDEVAKAISARYYKDGSEILVNQKGWRNPRRLLPREVMLLMGFEDEYAELFGHKNGFPQMVSDTQAYRQLGNAVVPKIVEDIGAKIVQTISKAVQFSDDACLIKGRAITRSSLVARN